MTEHATDQEPFNELESQLAALMQGAISEQDFLQTFLKSNLYIMVDGEPQGNVLGDKQPLVFAFDENAPPMLAVFSNPTRAATMVEHFKEYSYPIMVDCTWVFDHVPPGMGVAFNPGCANGFELAPPGAEELRNALAEARRRSAE